MDFWRDKRRERKYGKLGFVLSVWEIGFCLLVYSYEGYFFFLCIPMRELTINMERRERRECIKLTQAVGSKKKLTQAAKITCADKSIILDSYCGPLVIFLFAH